jgi:NTP pyrophosphatase (non-canonical NTP hydrolase)
MNELKAFQAGVDKWMDACFGDEIKADVQERCDRFIEEALEFVQAVGYSADRAHALVDYTFGRPQGEINQEVGGVMVTLAAMCNTLGVDIGTAAEAELARVWTKIDKIRAKQQAKPTGSALPIAARSDPDTRQLVEQRDALEVALRFLIRSVDDLIAESEGVYGLHLNGDPAPWDSLTEGGRFEAWLIELERARAALTSLDKPAIIDGPHGPEFCERLP